ncbi:MAG: SRPBCC domain-containing protein [Armatimonadota bacterium]
MEITRTSDALSSEFVVKAPLEKAWAALTTKDGWEAWFSDRVNSDFQVGSPLVMYFDGYGEQTGTVVERDEHRSFAYQWHPGEGDWSERPDAEKTTVRFTIEPVDSGTKITMVESGFSRVLEARRPKAFEDNTGGWSYMMKQIVRWLEDDVRQSGSIKE